MKIIGKMMLKNSAILAFLLKYKKEPLGIRRARVFVCEAKP